MSRIARRVAERLLGRPLDAAITIATLAFIVWAGGPLLEWAVLDARWTGQAADCRLHEGACWAFAVEKARFMLFAFFPAELHWRPLTAIVLLLGFLAAAATPRLWSVALIPAWAAVLVACWLLLSGVGGGPAVSTNQWGGLTVTLFVWIACFGAALPPAVLLALARRSDMGGLRTLTVAFIELMRGTPMVAVLYAALLIAPMMFPDGRLIDKLLRVMAAVTLFWSAYLAEVVRAGLQSIPPGQWAAAAALGLGYWRTVRLVVLPQALRAVIPGLVNQAIGFLLATSLLTVVGIFDLLNAARASATDPDWLGYYDEAYATTAAVYFLFCHLGSRYSAWLERRLSRSS
jgi:general L-amino acid transport system permease protein